MRAQEISLGGREGREGRGEERRQVKGRQYVSLPQAPKDLASPLDQWPYANSRYPVLKWRHNLLRGSVVNSCNGLKVWRSSRIII
jgi:hypothetical protein